MGLSNLQRHQVIESLTKQQTGNVAEAAVVLWAQMATKIISIVGEGGFHSLYARSVFLTQSDFPWLAACPMSPQKDQRFAELKACFASQSPVEASAANSLLLFTFTDILASLIGEELTTSMLRSAWGDNASDQAGKECKNE